MLQRQWFVNRNFDITFFIGPYLLTWVVILLVPKDYLVRDDYLVYAPLLIWFLIEIVFVAGHIWSTLFRTFFEKETRSNYSKTFLFGVPLLAFLTLFSLSTWSLEITIRFLFYAAIYHGLKQVFGIAALYSTRFNYLNAIETPKEKAWSQAQRVWDKRLLGGSFALCFLYWHLTLPEFISIPLNFAAPELLPWLLGESLYQLLPPDSWQNIAIWAFYLSFLPLLIGWGRSYIKASIPIHWIRFVWVLLNVITFYWVFVFYSGTFLLAICLNSIHAIAYYGINGLYQRQRGTSLKKFVLLSVCFATINIILLKTLVDTDRPEFVAIASNFLHRIGELDGLFLSLAFALFFTVDVSHYLYDAYLWRFNKKNPKLFDSLIRQAK